MVLIIALYCDKIVFNPLTNIEKERPGYPGPLFFASLDSPGLSYLINLPLTDL